MACAELTAEAASSLASSCAAPLPETPYVAEQQRGGEAQQGVGTANLDPAEVEGVSSRPVAPGSDAAGAQEAGTLDRVTNALAQSPEWICERADGNTEGALELLWNRAPPLPRPAGRAP